MSSHVVLVHPHPGPKDRDCHILPLGPLYVAAPLVANGIAVSAIDQRKDPDWKRTLAELVKRPGTVCAGISIATAVMLLLLLRKEPAGSEASAEPEPALSR